MDKEDKTNASDFTGKDLLKSFEAKVDGDEWKVGNRFIFSGGRYQIKIEANPRNQPGDGRLSVGGQAHRWETLKPILSDSSFNKKYKSFLENKLNSSLVNDFEKMELECCALLLFEIARRVENERGIDVNFLTRDEVDEAIDKALNCELGSLLTGIFCLSKKRRRSRYDEIMSKLSWELGTCWQEQILHKTDQEVKQLKCFGHESPSLAPS